MFWFTRPHNREKLLNRRITLERDQCYWNKCDIQPLQTSSIPGSFSCTIDFTVSNALRRSASSFWEMACSCATFSRRRERQAQWLSDGGGKFRSRMSVVLIWWNKPLVQLPSVSYDPVVPRSQGLTQLCILSAPDLPLKATTMGQLAMYYTCLAV